jgi:L-arabinokinase
LSLNIAIYTSAHGYGHATRCYEVARQIVKRHPDAVVFFVSPVPERIFSSQTHPRIQWRCVKLDVGVRQKDGFSVDLPGTLEDLRLLEQSAAERIAQEETFLAEHRVRVVLSDLPHLAFEAADRAGIPSLGLSNFTWDWIYSAYLAKSPEFAPIIKSLRSAYQKAQALLRLPLSPRMVGFRRNLPIPLIARKSEIGAQVARERLGIRESEIAVLFSFGGFGADLPVKPVKNDRVIFISTDPSPPAGEPFRHLTDVMLAKLDLCYPDLVAAADAVLSKPGYGIVSECIANRTALLYLTRSSFREYPVLVREMKKYLPCQRITRRSLAGGSWGDFLQTLKQHPQFPAVALDGAGIAAEILLETAQENPKARGM